MFMRKTILFNIPKVTNNIRSYLISLKKITDIEIRIGDVFSTVLYVHITVFI